MIKFSLVLLMALFGVAISRECYVYEGVHSEFTVRTTQCALFGFGTGCVTAKGGGFITTRCSKSCENDQPLLKRRVQEMGAEHGLVIAKEDIWTDCCSRKLCERAKVDDNKHKIQCWTYSGKRDANAAKEAYVCTGSTHCLTAAMRDIAVTKCVHQCSDLNKHIATTEAKKLVMAECTGSTHCLTAAMRDIAVTKCVHQCSDLNKHIATTEAKKLVMAEGHGTPSHQEIEVNCCSENRCNKEYIYPGFARLNITSTPKPKTTVGKITTGKKDTNGNEDTSGNEDTNENKDETGNKDGTGENGANGDEWFRGWQIGYGSEADNSANASNGANHFPSLFHYILGFFSIFYGLQ